MTMRWSIKNHKNSVFSLILSQNILLYLNTPEKTGKKMFFRNSLFNRINDDMILLDAGIVAMDRNDIENGLEILYMQSKIPFTTK